MCVDTLKYDDVERGAQLGPVLVTIRSPFGQGSMQQRSKVLNSRFCLRSLLATRGVAGDKLK